MDVLKITLDEDGKVLDFSPDFKVYRGSYKNILINVEVPKCLLIEEATDVDTGQNITGNNIRVGAIIRTATGRNIKTKGFGLSWVKDFTKKEVEYSLYQRRMPQVFTKWETVSQLEQATSGLLEMVFNVVNWHLDDNGAKIEQVVTAPIVPVDVYQTDYLDDEEEIDASELEILQGQVDNHEKKLIEMNKELFGDDSDALGTYLLTRLIAGNKIIIEKDETNAPNNQIKISFEPITAKEIGLEHIDEILSTDVQGAIRELNSRTNSKNIDSVKGIDPDMVDNEDPYNPIILHDPQKADLTLVEKEIDTVLAVAEGKTQSFTFDTLADLGTAFGIDTSVIANEYPITSTTIIYDGETREIKKGDIIWVVDTLVPDYWVNLDRMKLSKLEINPDLDGYVKFTDLATNSKVGLVRVGAGLAIEKSTGIIRTHFASDEDIETKTNQYKPIVPKNLDYAFKKAFTTNALGWKTDEKKLSRNLIEALGHEDFATAEKGGVVKVLSSNGIQILDGYIYIVPASNDQIKNRSNNYVVITPQNLEFAIVQGLVNNSIELTEEEKNLALSWLGAMSHGNFTSDLNKKVDIAQGAGNANKTMVTDAEGNITPSDVVCVGGVTIQKGTTEDGETCIEFVFPEESE